MGCIFEVPLSRSFCLTLRLLSAPVMATLSRMLRSISPIQYSKYTGIRKLVVKVSDPSGFEEIITKSKANKEEVFTFMYHTPWCKYCKQIAPKVDELSEQFKEKGVTFLAFDCNEEDNSYICDSRFVQAFPTFELIKNGKSVKHLATSDIDMLQNEIQNILDTES